METETAPRPAPALGSRFRGNDGGRVCGTRGSCGGGGPFDRLRANGISKRACDVGWWGSVPAITVGVRAGPAPLDTGFRRYDDGGREE